MKPLLSRTAAVAVAAALGACAAPAPHATLTYETAPAGATIYEGGQPLGVAPVTRSYAGTDTSAPISTPEVTAVWPSGAKATFWTVLKAGDDRVATLSRPAGAKGLDGDQANAKKYEDADARAKAEAQRAVKMNSARCRAQQSGSAGVSGIDDCN
jgi:hypothetical protein